MLSHDVLAADSPHLICSTCYNPPSYTKVLTEYSHTFRYGAIPSPTCANCSDTLYQSRPMAECPLCTRAYYRFIKLITYKEEATYRQLVGLAVNVKTLEIVYGKAEIRSDPNNLEALEESISS